jgi:adenine/guanine phosphoribosyltransferase-like PRPP-binding protein
MPKLTFCQDFPKQGVNFFDIFSATADPYAMRFLINGLIEIIDVRVGKFTHIVDSESKVLC